MEINGIAHTFVTVGDFARSRAFYSKLLPFLGLKNVMDIPGTYYCVGGRTGCFRARTREDVDEAYEFVKDLGAEIIHAPEEAIWAPGYYSILFEDPDGIRLEINFVPGKGLLK
jgi:catechol 2,3-dioxygenase-like lactoylglutathione lyase family enzyme